MEIVLGVSVTTTTARMVLIEGENADGVIIECETFDTAAGAVKASPSERISAAILATQQNAVANGHHLVLSGVVWDDERAAGELSGGNVARDLHNVVLVSQQNSAGALARTVGRALGYDTTAVLVMAPETATLSVVDSDDGSIVEAHVCAVDGMDVTDILPAIATAIEARNPKPGSVFVVGSKAAVCSVKTGLEKLIDQPVIVPEEPEFALARGAALAAANVPCADASTCGLAYSRDPDELSAADRFSVKPADADTQAAVLEPIAHDGAGTAHRRAVPWPPISFSSAVAATLVVGGVSVAMLVAANVAGTADRGAVAAEAADSSALVPVASPPPAIPAATVLPVPQQLPVAPPVPQPAPAPTLPKPAVQERAPLVQVRQPVPSRVITEPAPVAVEKPLLSPPIAVDPEPVEALPAPAPALALPPPVFTAPSPAVSAPPIYPSPGASPAPPVATSPWTPPWLRFGTPQSGQQAQPAPWPQQFWPGLQNLWPHQHESQPQLTPQLPQSTPAQIPQWTPSPVPQWTPAPVVPQWTPDPSLQSPQVPATSLSPYPNPYPYPTLRGPSTSGAYLLPPAGLDPPVGGFR